MKNAKSVIKEANISSFCSCHYNSPCFYASAAENPVFRDERLNLSIFELNDIEKRQKIFSSENDFESEEPYWNQSPNKSNEQAYSESFSEKLDEFSASCTILLDTILPYSITQLVIEPKLRIFANNDAECNLMIAMDSDGKQYYWQGFDLSKYVKSKGSWWPVSLNVVIDRKTILKNSTLKIYIWNNKKNEIYIDNFGLDLYSTSK